MVSRLGLNQSFFKHVDFVSYVFIVSQCRSYEINYLMVVKLEYQYIDRDFSGTDNRITAQFAIGF